MNEKIRKSSDKKISFIALFALLVIALMCFAVIRTTPVNAENKVLPSDSVELYQLAPETGSLMQSYVIKTSNNKIVVIDGGIDGDGLNSPTYLPSAIRAILGLEDGAYFEVEGWFISHAHADHYNELCKMLGEYNAQSNYKINNFYFDFPADFSIIPAQDYDKTLLNKFKMGLDNYASVNGITTDSYYDELNSSVINEAAINEGLVIDIDGVKFEILQTWTTTEGTVNDTSLVMKMYVEDQSVLFLNDVTEISGARLADSWPVEKVKSDIVQMAHHGQAGADKPLYDIVDAKVHLWPSPAFVWDNPDVYPIGEVRSWVGATEVADDYNLVACLYESYPQDPTSVEDWKGCIDGMKISLPYYYAYENPFEMKEGASIRLNSDSTGIRFTAKLAQYDADAEYGFVIVPKHYITSNNISSDYVPALIERYGEDGIIKLKSAVKQVGLHYEINGSIANILYENMNLEFTGIAYEYKNGSYNYASFDSLDDISRSVSSVAQMASNDFTYGSDSGLTEEDMEIINGFIKAGINLKNGVEESLNQSTEPEIVHEFSVDNLKLSLGEQNQLSLNTSFDSRAIIWESDNSECISVLNGTLTALKPGSATVTAKCAGYSATITVDCEMKEGYLAEFNSAYYENIITDGAFSAGTYSTEYFEEYNGEKSVVKVTLNVDESSNGYFTIKLPKAMTSADAGFTIRYMVESSDATAARFFDPVSGSDLTTGQIIGLSEGDLGVWKTVHAAGQTGKLDEILVYFWDSAIDTPNVMYISLVADGNRVDEIEQEIFNEYFKEEADSLPEGILADFDNAVYEKSVQTVNGWGSVKATYLPQFGEEKNVLKLEGTSLDNNCGYTINLPKSMSSGEKGFTIRYYVESNDATASKFFDPATQDNYPVSVDIGNENAWKNLRITGQTGKLNQIMLYFYAGTSHVIYISCIADGDMVNELGRLDIENALKAEEQTLEQNFLADFDSEIYESFVSADMKDGGVYSPKSITTEFLAEYNGETNVLKVETENISTPWYYANFIINLPKSMGENGFTVKYMLERSDSDHGYFQDTKSETGLKAIDMENKGVWQTAYVSGQTGSLNQIRITFWNDTLKDSCVNTMYFSFIQDGNTAN